MKRTNLFIILLISFVLLSCSHFNYTLKKVPEKHLSKYQLCQLNKDSNLMLFIAYKDHGPPSNIESFFVIKKKQHYYKVNPKYDCQATEDAVLIIESRGMKVNLSGNWILFERKINNDGNEEFSFNYDTIPNYDITMANELEEGVYYFENGIFKKIGLLTDFTSMHQMKKNGFYYLTPPGVFYKKKITYDNL